MSPEERARIFSNDYADLLIEYNGDETVFAQFKDATVQILNYEFAVVRVPVAQITSSTILNLGYSVMPSCFGLISSASLDASGITKIRNQPRFNLRGQGVLMGFLDSGIDYTNPIFVNEDKTSRIVSIWDQSIDSADRFPEGTDFGTEYKKEDLNLALSSPDPYEIVATKDEVGHGTMLAGVAAGSEVEESNFYGVATDSELVVVKLKQAKPYLKDFFLIPIEANCYQENDIMMALIYLYNISVSLKRPMVICLGLGTAQGAHDGRGSLSNFISVMGNITGIAIVVAVGNEGNRKKHYYGEVDETIGYDTVELNVGEVESQRGFSMELWGNSPGVYSIDILSPTGESIPRIPARLDENREISFVFEKTIIYLDYQMVESQSGDQLILLRIRNPTVGIWRFRVFRSGDLKTGFNIWLPMDKFISEGTFFIRSDPNTTVLSLGNSIVPIAVTAYNPENDSIYLYASKGFSRIGVITPVLTAPGVNVISPNLEKGFESVSGTSVSAAHTSGVVAMMLEWGILRGNSSTMDSVEAKKFLIRGARRNENTVYPNNETGFGILDIYQTFDVLRSDREEQ